MASAAEPIRFPDAGDRAPRTGLYDRAAGAVEIGPAGRMARAAPQTPVAPRAAAAPGTPVGPANAGRDRAPYEFALLNLAAAALLAAAYLQGWVDLVLAADGTGLTLAIFGVFLGGLALAAAKLRQLSGELARVRNPDPARPSLASGYLSDVAGRSAGSRAIAASTLKARLVERMAIVRYLAGSLVLLGLVGTVLGFIIALSGVDPDEAGDVRQVAPMVSELVRGMSVALYTTLVGSILNLWLMANYRVLAGATTRLATELIALGERNARPGIV